jgi:CRISPR-associated protein Cst2
MTNKQNKLTHIAGTFLIQAEGAFLNGAGLDTGEDRNAVIPKTYLDGRNRVPYVSSQAWRRWLRNTFQEENPHEPAAEIKEKGQSAKGTTNKIGTEMNPIVYAEDDVFGYFWAEKAQGKSKKDDDLEALDDELELEEQETKSKKGKTEKVATVMRPAPFVSSILKSLRSNGWQGEDEGFVHLRQGSPLPYKTKFYNTQLQGVFGLNYSRLGVFRNDGDRIELSEKLVKQYQGDGTIQAQNGSENIYEVVNNKRRERATMILRALAVLRGGAKQAQFGTDTAPKAIIVAGLNCGNLIFNDLFAEQDGQPIIKLNALTQTIDDYRSRIVTPVFIGIRDGYLHSQNENDVRSWIESNEVEFDVRLSSPVKAIESLTQELANID